MNKGLLEKFSGAAAAYSVRLLNRNYTGALMKVRRVDSVTSQDNGEIFVFPDNTGWVSLNSKVVDPSHASQAKTLGDFVNAQGFAQSDSGVIGGNPQHAYVAVWKDQSGNSNDASQTTTTAQPQIVSTGALIVENGKPAVEFDGVDDQLTHNITGLASGNFTYIDTFKSSDGAAILHSSTTTNTKWVMIAQTSTSTQLSDGFVTAYDGYYKNGVQPLSSGATRTDFKNAFFDGGQNLAFYYGTTNAISVSNMYLGRYYSSGFEFSGLVQESILYTSDQSSNRIDIEEDINTAFNIYNNAPTPKKNSFLGKYPGAAAAYSTRNLTGKSKQPILKVRRELGTDTDTEETIYSSNNQLDTNQLLNFVNGVSEDPRLPLDISEGYGYSLRLVKSGYQGPLVEVRESSGNTTKDFYADSTGKINEQALLDFCGSNDGHISKWYNQSGVDRHLTSDAAANEPKIVESGVVVKDTLGNVALKFTNAGNEFLAIQDATAFDLQEQTIAMHFMSTALPASASKRIIGISQAIGETFDASIRNNVSISATGYITLTAQSTAVTLNNIPQTVNSPSILTINFKGSNTSGTSNKTTQSTTLPTTSVRGLSVGARYTTTATPDFLTSEVIQYTSAQIGDNKNEIEASLNKQYKIYGDAYVSTWYDQSTAASDNLLLDDNPDAAAAYSLRKLRTLYQGSAINVRRASDNATKDIGFTSSGELDVDDIINFCAGSNGFVTTWYNQAFTSKNELLLDTTAGSGAAAAYSVRQLSSTATECMVIRRSDGKTRTIGFKDTHIDEAAIESFCVGSTCTVQEWKDQSGNNNHATQSTPANQPTIYTGGALVKDDGRVAVDFSNDTLTLGTSINTNALGVFSMHVDTANSYFPLRQGTTNYVWLHTSYGQLRAYMGGVFAIDSYTSLGTMGLRSFIKKGTTGNEALSYVDGVNITTAGYSDLDTESGTFTTLGAYTGKAQEVIVYTSDKSTDRTSIESNINNYYGIFSTNNAEQDVALNQPKIYDSSTGVITENGKPAVQFDGSNDNLKMLFSSDLAQPAHHFAVAANDDVSNIRILFSGNNDTSKRHQYEINASGNWTFYAGSSITATALATIGQHVHSVLANGSSSNFHEDAALLASGDAGNFSLDGLTIGARTVTNAFPFLGNIQEYILYASDQSSRRLNIEGNINNHYRIYGINDASQATALNQPQLVSNGRVILENGKPAVQLDGTNDYLTASTSDLFGTNFSLYFTHRVTGGSTRKFLIETTSTGSNVYNPSLEYSESTIPSKIRTFSGSGATSTATIESTNTFDSSQRLITVNKQGTTNFELFADSVSLGTATPPNVTGMNGFNLGTYRSANDRYFGGTFQEFVIYNSDQSTNRTGIEQSINKAFGIYWDGTKTGLLDNQPNAAAAYSVRALSSSYTGPLIEIRDANGNTRNIYATYNGDLDEAAIEAFCSGTTCTVATWYDQSGGSNNATQPTATSQPTIYANGAVVKDNGRVAALFAGDYLNSGTVSATGTATNFAVAHVDGGSSNRTIFYTPEVFAFRRTGDFAFLTQSTQVIYASVNLDDRNLHYFGANGTQGFGTINGGAITTFAQAAGSGTKIAIGTQSSNAIPFYGYIQEALYYASDKSTDRTSIERDINQYFNIYTDPGPDRLLNKYPGAAAAYSLRKLNSQYTGPAVRVRRDSDGVHADVYFDLNATISKYSRVGVLSSSTDPIAAASTTTLQTFMGSNNGFVSVWYDQASSNNTTQSTAINQPKIYDSSTGVVTSNGKPAIYFSTSHQLKDTTWVSGNVNVCDIINVHQMVSSTAGQILFWYDGSFQRMGIASGNTVLDWGSGTVGEAVDTDQHLIYARANNGSGQIWTDSVAGSVGTTSSTRYFSDLFWINGNGFYGINDMVEMYQQELVFYTSNQSESNRTGIQTNINNHYSIYAKPKRLLDQYGGAAAAYSLRSLHSNYTGPLVTIRRDSDGIEVDVYADINGEFSLNSIVKDVAETTTGATQASLGIKTPVITLSQFVQGSPNCYVVEWKDQSGNGNHATQTTAANQPKIYDSVTGVVTENGKPAITYTSGTGVMLQSANFATALTQPTTWFATGASNNTGDEFMFSGGSPSSNSQAFGTRTTTFQIYAGAQINTTSPRDANQHVWSIVFNGANTNAWQDGSQVVTNQNAGSNGITRMSIFNLAYASVLPWEKTIQEIILYSSDQSTNRANIESNINTFYSIY